ncbi:uncharacterized protein LOC18040262 isoform X1 [Citrus clementina]|uniref:uncharacterized protein LOC18040262 isoform X1 n=1 Tax=Citrus clementina TaxID=85681 RepID=UPI000CED69AA|nr:uncharacterized protein LOC18040262 isoform X1 [Citrus x clementina]XP_024040793.1 uncharacterized protein LOC18040262 isoform X1 [Citrus x clementina]
MLLWMGGSRRKVTTSRKSAQKRQKQYFEQRKRQHQQAAVLDSHADPKEHRSLDVLSLLNLSTTAEERKCACLNDSVDYKEVVTSSGYQAETISPKNFKFTASDSQNNAFNESSCDSYLRKTTNIQQISVFDLLADDGPSGNLEASPVHEAHVAFSVEGLGKVGTQTPILSPEQCERDFRYKCMVKALSEPMSLYKHRMFQYVCSSPQKAARRHNLLKNFDYVWDDLELEVDVMMQDTNKPMSGGYLEFSSGTINSRSHRKLKYSTVQDCEPFDGCGSKLQNSFGDSEFFHGVGNNSEDLWDVPARSSFVDDNLHIENRLNASGRNWQSQSYGNELSDSAFEFPHLHKNRVLVKAADRYNILDSSSPKRQISENNGDFITSKMTRYPSAGRNSDFKEPISQLDWSYHEDARDDLSLLSEESCSSTAVRGEAKNISSSNSLAKQSRRPKDISGSDGNTNGLKNIYAKGKQHQKRFDFHQGSYTCGSGKCTKMPNPSKSKQFHQLNSPFQEVFGPRDSLFVEGYNSADVNSDSGSFCQTLEMKVPSFGSKPQIVDSFSGFPIPESQMCAKSYFDGCKYGNSVQYSSLRGIDSEKSPFCKSLCCMSCHDPPICLNLDFVPMKPSLSLDSEPVHMPSASFHVPGSHGEMLFPDLSALESVGKDERSRSKAQSAVNKKFEPDKRSCSGNNCLLSVNTEAINSSTFEYNVIECKEAKAGLSEQNGTEATPSPDHVEEALLSYVRNPDRFEIVADKVYVR